MAGLLIGLARALIAVSTGHASLEVIPLYLIGATLFPLIDALFYPGVLVASVPAADARDRDYGTLRELMRHTAMFLLALLLAACSPRQTTPADVSPDPASGTTIQGRFALGFAVDRATLRPGDEVKGTATLSLLSPGGATISGSSSLVVFEFTEIGGEGRHVVPVRTTDCAPQRLTSTVPIVNPITKSGAVPDGPNADWYRTFFSDPVIHLPKGEWDITASASFFDGEGCRGQTFDLRTTVRVHVIE